MFIRFLAALLAALLLLPAASAEDIWQERAYVAFSEPHGVRLFNNRPGSIATLEGVTYKLPAGLTGQAREDLVDRVQRVLAQIRAVAPSARPLTVVVCGESYLPRVDGDTLWVGLPELQAPGGAAALVKLVCGNDLPAALMRGWGSLIDDALGLSVPLPSVEEALRILPQELLDLNEACFVYADAAQRDALLALSRALAREALNRRLLPQCPPEDFVALRTALLEAHGLPARDGGLLDRMTFSGGGEAVRLIWHSEAASCTLFDDYRDFYAGMGFGEDPFNDGYADFRRQVLNLEAQMAWVRGELAPYLAVPRVEILFEQRSDFFTTGGVQGIAGYVDSANVLHVGSLFALLHEYVHAATAQLRLWDAPWRTEAIAYYLMQLPEDPALNYQKCVWNELAAQEPFLVRSAARLGHPFDAFRREDMSFLYHGLCQELDSFHVLQGQPRAVCAFLYWLMERHEHSAILTALIADEPQAQLGASWEELIQAWRSYVWSAYAWVKDGE